MRVGLVAQPADGVLPPRQNSIGLITYNTAVELAREIDVSLICKARTEGHEAGELGFELEPLQTPWDDLLGDVTARYPRWAGKLGFRQFADQYPEYARAASRVLRRSSCQVAHVMNYWQWCRTVKKSGSAVVLEMQSEWLSQMDKDRVEQQLQAADAVVGVSEHIVKLFRQAFPGYGGVVATAYNGVDVDTFRPSESAGPSPVTQGDRERRVLFVGRMSPEKGVHVLLEAFAAVVERCPDVVLELAGPRTVLPFRFLVGVSSDPLVRRLDGFYDGSVTSDYQQHLDHLVERFGLGHRVRFLGSLPHKELVARYQTASLVVNPSFSESFGISIVEGMACAVPVIGTRVGGMQETIVHGETGWLVDADEPAALAEAMRSILEDPGQARGMGQRGRQRAVEVFSWAARARRLVDVYRRVAS